MSEQDTTGPTGTTIKQIVNESNQTVAFVRAGSAETVAPNSSRSTSLLLPSDDTTGYQVIGDEVCRIWDKAWKVWGRYEGSSETVMFLDGGGQGVGGNISVTVKSDGKLSMKKH